MNLLLREVEVEGRLVDVRCSGGRIGAIEPRIEPAAGEEEIGGAGGALLPGLHDHHLHLLAMAAALESVDLGPEHVRSADDLDAALHSAAVARGGAWVRAVGFDERTGGALDRARLDRIAPSSPVRVQHRSGHLWVLNSAACAVVGLGDPGGRLFDGDAWLAERVGDRVAPDIAPVGRLLAAYGVTGVTDMTPSTDLRDWELLSEARRLGALPQRIVVSGAVRLAATAPPATLAPGPVKVVVSDHELPAIEDLAAGIRTAHRAGRPVAFHCVTRVAAVITIAAWRDAGSTVGDRMEHGAVLDDELTDALADLGVTVVTQPGFLADRGDRYLTEVAPEDLPWLYRCAGLVDHGVPLGGSTDAPFGPADPWAAMAAAVDRRAASGVVLGPTERLTPTRALELFLTAPEAPGGAVRRVAVGEPADLCLLDAPLTTVLDELDAAHVAATIVAGSVEHA